MEILTLEENYSCPNELVKEQYSTRKMRINRMSISGFVLDKWDFVFESDGRRVKDVRICDKIFLEKVRNGEIKIGVGDSLRGYIRSINVWGPNVGLYVNEINDLLVVEKVVHFTNKK